jgi:hypothetical protein
MQELAMGLFTSVMAAVRDKRYRLASASSHLSMARCSALFRVITTRIARPRPESQEDKIILHGNVLDTIFALFVEPLPTNAPHVPAELLNAPTVGADAKRSKADNGFGAAVACY